MKNEVSTCMLYRVILNLLLVLQCSSCFRGLFFLRCSPNLLSSNESVVHAVWLKFVFNNNYKSGLSNAFIEHLSMHRVQTYSNLIF